MARTVLPLFFGALLAFAVGAGWRLAPDLFAPPVEPRVITARGDLSESEDAVIALFEATRDSVVSISTTEAVTNPFTRRRVEVPRGTGSGFVWDGRGHVVTNDHVMAGANEAQVRLADGRAFRGRLVGRSPAHDLAVLRIDVRSLPPPVAVGTSDDLQVGQRALAIGNPFGLDWTLTTGIVSALDRELPGQGGRPILGLIQTDAAINPGNSGGPLLDSAGRLIGVNTAIYSPSGGSAGIGFAVPVGTVNRVVPQLIAEGSYSPPVLGIELDQGVNEMATRQGIDGVLVLGVRPGSPAADAGLEPAELRGGRLVPRDVIVAVDGEGVDAVGELLSRLDTYRAGEAVTLTLRRGGGEREVQVPLAEGG